MNRLITALLLCTLPLAVNAEIRVFACEPEWAALADEIGGDLVESFQRDDSATGSALHPGTAQPDRKGTSRGPRHLQRRATRDRLVASAPAKGEQSQGPAWQ